MSLYGLAVSESTGKRLQPESRYGWGIVVNTTSQKEDAYSRYMEDQTAFIGKKEKPGLICPA